MARTILHYGTEYLGTPAQLGVIPEGVLIADPDTNTIKIGNGVDAGGVSVTVQANVAFSDITGKPTTLAGYGITDAQSTTSGTLPSDRLPTVPTTKGGTGLTTIGTANQVLAVNGTGTALEFQDVASGSGTTINNNADNRIITGSATAGTLEAEGNFTFNGTDVNLIGNILVSGRISGGNTTVSGDLTFYNDAGATLVGKIQNNNDRLEFVNGNGLRMFYFFDEGGQDIQVERPLVIAGNQYLSTNKIQQSAGASGDIEIEAGSSGSVIIETGTNNEINVTNGLVDITGNITASGTISGIMQLPVLSAAPSSPADGMMAIADGTNWNVHGGTTPGLTIYYDGQWWPGTPFVI